MPRSLRSRNRNWTSKFPLSYTSNAKSFAGKGVTSLPPRPERDTIALAMVYAFGVFELDEQTGELRKSGITVRLAGKPRQALTLLLERHGELVTRQEIKEALWEDGTFTDFDHGVDTAIERIRRVLGDSARAPRFIETLPREGYRFLAPVYEKEAVSGSARSKPAAEATLAAPRSPFWPAASLRRRWSSRPGFCLTLRMIRPAHRRRSPSQATRALRGTPAFHRTATRSPSVGPVRISTTGTSTSNRLAMKRPDAWLSIRRMTSIPFGLQTAVVSPSSERSTGSRRTAAGSISARTGRASTPSGASRPKAEKRSRSLPAGAIVLHSNRSMGRSCTTQTVRACGVGGSTAGRPPWNCGPF